MLGSRTACLLDKLNTSLELKNSASYNWFMIKRNVIFPIIAIATLLIISACGGVQDSPPAGSGGSSAPSPQGGA